jgi:predicted metalloprotease
MRRAGGVGIGTIIILGLIGWALGINPLLLIGGAEILPDSGGTQQEQPAPSDARAGLPDQMREFVSAVLGSTEVQWKEIFAQAGKTYPAPTLVMFSGVTRSACGVAQSAMGPFYCPMIRKSISTPPSSKILSGDFVAATSAAKAVDSHRLT